MIRQRLKQVIDACFEQGVRAGKWSADLAGKYTVEVPKREGQGDFSTNMALILAGTQKSNPRQIATQLVALLEQETELIDHLEIAGPGFVNIFLNTGVWHQTLFPVLEQRNGFGLSTIGQGKRVMVEFVSANPTGPLSIG
ncbi:MAG: arginine--tRNA ligase, partial [Proteobacteria bacterium]|nr:arginine--tRNA ligase [Pseudomonadota bacterium]